MLLVALVLPLDGPTPRPDAKHMQGWLYHAIREHAPGLHDHSGPKPFTVASAGRDAGYVRLTFLDESLYAALSPTLYALPGKTLALGGHPYRVKAVLQEGHPWAGMSTWQRLFQGEASADAPLRFVSPTFFRRQGNNYPLPEPKLVFGSLIERWNAHAPLRVPAEIALALSERVTFRYLQLSSRSATAHDRTVGCVGRATYHLPQASSDEAAWLSALTRFAFYSGVGAKTTLGFGQAKPYRPRPLEQNPPEPPSENNAISMHPSA